MSHGSTSLPARLYLLAWDTDGPRQTGARRIAHLVRAGALTELAQRGLLVDVEGIATPADPDAGTGDAVLDGLLELVAESMPRPWKTWVSLHSGVTLDTVRAQLVADGLMRVEKKRLLGFFPAVEYELEGVRAVEALQQEVREMLVGPAPVTEISDRDAALVALAAAAGLPTVVTEADRGRHRERIEALTDRSGAAAPALRRVVREVRTALIAAATAGTAG
ncbi:GOLPH3/VPS74 family protein [Streptomyces chiangmaiensis]|uniref:GPP34 family phosphoprotein n=1 Tax=Streptomyces chiangmaiensis TaxID=766497 RepID=A0ABU7FUB8_9ACTN|nr:GPP34 family phosphoprotein [Streptomyces chiangmaiensis]MED7827437.1 GPP34 family phosphoprotein [Streptomyces chiangmaiensis]